jgi:hypothetical protein
MLYKNKNSTEFIVDDTDFAQKNVMAFLSD